MEESEDRYLSAAFVTFKNRWVAAIAAQTQLATNPLVGHLLFPACSFKHYLNV